MFLEGSQFTVENRSICCLSTFHLRCCLCYWYLLVFRKLHKHFCIKWAFCVWAFHTLFPFLLREREGERKRDLLMTVNAANDYFFHKYCSQCVILWSSFPLLWKSQVVWFVCVLLNRWKKGLMLGSMWKICQRLWWTMLMTWTASWLWATKTVSFSLQQQTFWFLVILVMHFYHVDFGVMFCQTFVSDTYRNWLVLYMLSLIFLVR